MTEIGVEVGQKMRSAIKAKLTELDCYVDDELPDYIMVMIANKRTKLQMKEDLNLFLSGKTGQFVDWLHAVLKKLKEVQVTNPDVFKNPLKRKQQSFVISTEDLKKVKKEKGRKVKKENEEKSLTDDLPITANKLSEARKIVVMNEKENSSSQLEIDEHDFNIPLLSEINSSNEEELELIEKRIKSVKNRLGLQVDSEDDDTLNIKPDPGDMLFTSQSEAKSVTEVEQPQDEAEELIERTPSPLLRDIPKKFHSRITFDTERDSLNAKRDLILHRNPEKSPKKKSVLDRLGKRTPENPEKQENKEDARQKLQKIRTGKDLVVMSKVSVPPKRPKKPNEDLDEEEEIKRSRKDVESVIKIKPRVLPEKSKQANPNLLFKAVADAQRSVTQTPKVGPVGRSKSIFINQSKELFTRKYKQQLATDSNPQETKAPKITKENKEKLQVLLQNTITNKTVAFSNEANSDDDDEENQQRPVKQQQQQQFIITLDGMTKSFPTKESSSIVKVRKNPSPIIFKSSAAADKAPEKPVAVVLATQSGPLKSLPPKFEKEKDNCKYWPNCRLGDRCEFNHPVSAQCKNFPNCKFADRCIYKHPPCKFQTSCTRKECPFSHQQSKAANLANAETVCKYFPNCSNANCLFYHPKLCKFGLHCKNQQDCPFLHKQPVKANLIWRPDNSV